MYGSYAVAIGENSQSHASYSVAVGANSQADESYEFSVGRDKIGEGEDKKAIYRQITHVANGTKAHDAVNLSQAKALIKEALVSGEIDAGNTTSSVTGAKIKAALDQKMDKSALNGYAKSSELATKANTSDLDAYAKADGSNVTTPATWATKLGTGEVATGNANLVTGGKVFDAIKDKADKSTLSDYAKATALTELETKVTNITNGTTQIDGSNINLATNTTFTTLQGTVNGKANTNADNITVSDWATKLGTGDVATGNTNLVTGGTVFNAIKDKADKSELSDYAKTSALADLETKVTNITNGTTKIDVTNIDLKTNNTFKTLQGTVNGKANVNADNITVGDWAGKLGTGAVATGDTNLVTGGTVYTALSDYAKTSALSAYAKSDDLTELKTQVTNITNGTTQIDVANIDLKTNNTFKTLQGTVEGKADKTDLEAYAKKDATNITGESLTKWQSALGNGTIAENNNGLVTGGTVHTALKGKADKNAENIEVLAWKKKLGLVDAQATEDTGSNISTELSKIKNGFKISDGTNSSSIVWGTAAPVMTFKGTNGITANVNNTEITFGIDWANVSAPKFHIYQAQVQGESRAAGRRRRVRSVEDTSNVPGTLIGSMNFDQVNMVFGKGLKAETKSENGTTYTLISLAGNSGMSKFTVKTDEKDETTQQEKTFDVESGGSKAQLNVAGDGKNISTSIDKDNNTVKVSLKDDVSINSLTAKTVTTDAVKVNDKVYLDKDGLHANDQVISNVKAGKEDSDAVNVGQLKALAGHTDKIGRAVGKLAVESRNGDALNAALSALRPLDYDPESKFDVSAGYGTYKGVHAMAVGTFYRPNATTLFSIGGSFTGGDSMMNAGVSFKVGSGSGSQTYLSRQAIASMLKRFSVEHEAMKNVLAEQDARTQAQIEALQKENSSLKDKVNRLEKENNDRIEKANNRIAELERQVKEVLINLKK